MNTTLITLAMVSAALGLAGCENQSEAVASIDKKVAPVAAEAKPLTRWYTQIQVDRGAPLYQTHCASCHKPDASGTPDWKKTTADGKYPPPPLNGTAHAWHHPLSILRQQIGKGGAPVGGTMPAFSGQLNANQIDDILAWVQSHWSDEVYGMWHERDAQSSKSLQRINQG